jgi:S-DNA-T family DNA segregation ATPase FtsK/SpoIIIE
MGRNLFHATADNAEAALVVLARLIEVLDDRGRRMAGVSRLHQPAPGDPLHVLVIDELADLIAYSPPDVKKEANRLLAVILTQGRALGVVVVACVQDPHKETVGMRGLFTQTIALRLRSADESRMVLGDGMAALAPAHRLSPAAQGSAWVVEDDGSVDRVRADYWPDPLIRQIADTYRPTSMSDLSVVDFGDMTATVHEVSDPGRKPRAPRAPRAPRLAQVPSDQSGGEAA